MSKQVCHPGGNYSAGSIALSLLSDQHGLNGFCVYRMPGAASPHQQRDKPAMKLK
jgi:hypothetical protein